MFAYASGKSAPALLLLGPSFEPNVVLVEDKQSNLLRLFPSIKFTVFQVAVRRAASIQVLFSARNSDTDLTARLELYLEMRIRQRNDARIWPPIYCADDKM